MSSDDSLSPKAMDYWDEVSEAHTREVVAENARREKQPRLDRVNAGLSKILPLAAARAPHVSEADADFAKVLRQQISSAPTDASLAAAEGFLDKLGLLPKEGPFAA
ncbi:hypothetical protein [Paraburkholderia fungorum]|uniref:hypothetical protein n=1 Tax=Paraburkholderia fungorum TaxID=134537 RepID=UPI00180CB717|nr:hypothetical protein [Paraburkholderia fungorum]MBB5546574.1 hypothetical protein [Paraburkholderia fungorum]